MTLSCGGKRCLGTANAEFLWTLTRKNITQIVEKAQAAGIKVYLLTSTMITENPKHPNNQKLAAYNDFLRKLAAEKILCSG